MASFFEDHVEGSSGSSLSLLVCYDVDGTSAWRSGFDSQTKSQINNRNADMRRRREGIKEGLITGVDVTPRVTSVYVTKPGRT